MSNNIDQKIPSSYKLVLESIKSVSVTKYPFDIGAISLIVSTIMGKVKISILFLLVVLFISMPTLAESSKIKVIYVSKMPEIERLSVDTGGLAELGTLLGESRETSPNVLFLHGGDSLAPSSMSSFDFGSHMIDILNTLEPTVMAIDELEFSYKEDVLIKRISEAAFPFTSANIYDPLSGGNIQGAEDSIQVEIDGYKIAIFSVVPESLIETLLPDRIKVLDPTEIIPKKARSLRAAGADIVILMAGFSAINTEALLLDGVVDLVLQGSHSGDSLRHVGKGLYGKQGDGKGNALVIELNLERKQDDIDVRYDSEVFPLIKLQPDPVVSKQIDYYLSVLSSIMDIKVGITETKLDTTRNAVRTAENAFGNLVADAFRNYYSADIGIVNGGSIRGDRVYSSGTSLTRRDILSELPFRNDTTIIKISGSKIWAAMENAISLVEKAKGRFLHVSGMNVMYCPDLPPGERIMSIRINGEPLRENQKYMLATYDYLINGGDGFEMLRTGEPMRTSRTSVLMWEAVRIYIEKRGRIQPRIEGRLRIHCQ